MYIMPSKTLPHVRAHTYTWRDTKAHTSPRINKLQATRFGFNKVEKHTCDKVWTHDLPPNKVLVLFFYIYIGK